MEEKKYAQPIPVDLNAYRESLPKPAGDAVVGLGFTDEVKLSAIVYKNHNARRSLSVHHLQRRLLELGFKEAALDRDGWFGDSTQRAIRDFQRSKGLTETNNSINMETLTAVFAGDPNVTVKE